jgi:hypothetical protein
MEDKLEKQEELKEWKSDLESALEAVNPITNPYSSAVLQKELADITKKLKQVFEW